MMKSEIFGACLSEVAYMFGTRSSTNSLTRCSLVILIPEFLSGAHKLHSNHENHAGHCFSSIKQMSLYPSSHSITVLTTSYLSLQHPTLPYRIARLASHVRTHPSHLQTSRSPRNPKATNTSRMLGTSQGLGILIEALSCGSSVLM